MTHCSLRWGLSAFFLIPCRRYCGSFDRQCEVRPLCSPTTVASNRHVPWAAPNTPTGSTALLSRRQKWRVSAGSRVSCGSKRLPTLPPHTAVSLARTCSYRCQGLPKSAHRSSLIRPSRRSPSTISALSTDASRRSFLCPATRSVASFLQPQFDYISLLAHLRLHR